ncbi:hypothetical protein WICANDRAFT_61846 [Wickerhamomyces anomalus NRRL Y-366-8]|uniref:Quinate transporter n=1 Tax=Wickerhamomyces anomalus (strain ATCC 58044 / CBS 1984 / NCYC 433 / NRRL Y-366-8) TaxID=683960 RepID=A0A1E3P7E3_WICAA|nr:uncharacterized protein WICANDRAFT_61846 [Wickerhamomyces anomalus NRRL Y-366-8]ODQ61288.1 hypothetical protein WICANDRAFT_61846 [Wickerhamomyces anomalus NRRL Y-366-8]
MSFKKQETRPTPKSVYNWRIYWSALLASWVAVIIGYDAGFVGGMISLKSFKHEFGLDKQSTSKQSWTSETIVSLFQAGAFFGALFIYPLGYKYGRKGSLIIATVLLLVGSAIQLASNSKTGLGTMYAGRVLTGLGIGAVSNLAPMYISEISPDAIRGQLVGAIEITWQCGGIIGFWINYGTSINIPDDQSRQWQIPVALQLVPPGIFALGVYTLPESPRWLFSVGKREQGLRNLCYLRQLQPDDEYIQYEVNVMENEIMMKKQEIGLGLTDPIKKILGSKSLLYRLFLSTSLFIIQNTIAVNAVNYYSPKIFKTMGVSSLNSSLLSTGIFGILKGVFCFVWSFYIIDKFGRRPCQITGLIICSTCMWYIGAYIKVANPTSKPEGSSLDSGGRAALAMFYIWTIGFALSWSGTPWVWNSEVFPTNLKSVTSSINAASNWFWAFIMARFTNQMIDKMKYGVFFFFASMMLVSLPIFYMLYPETKGIPVEYVDELFKHKPWRAHSIVLKLIERDNLERRELVRRIEGVGHSSDNVDKPDIEVVSNIGEVVESSRNNSIV